VSGTDYEFASLSFLGHAALGRRVRLELFGLFDRELHRERADDFHAVGVHRALTAQL